MRTDITSIPISEVFEPKDGCPLCRLRGILEQRLAVYITGAAMMEPDVRQETNRLGFCHTHYRRLLGQHKRLSVALMLESHLETVQKTAFATGMTGRVKSAATGQKDTCFVCEQINANMARFLSNICHLWEREKDFRSLYEAQPYFCLPHCRQLTETAGRCLPKKLQPDFKQITAERTRAHLETLQTDVSHFCKMFDYRSGKSDEDWGNARDAIERTIAFLTGESPDA